MHKKPVETPFHADHQGVLWTEKIPDAEKPDRMVLMRRDGVEADNLDGLDETWSLQIGRTKIFRLAISTRNKLAVTSLVDREFPLEDDTSGRQAHTVDIQGYKYHV